MNGSDIAGAFFEGFQAVNGHWIMLAAGAFAVMVRGLRSGIKWASVAVGAALAGTLAYKMWQRHMQRHIANAQPQGQPSTRPSERPRRVVDISPDDDAERCCKCGIHRDDTSERMTVTKHDGCYRLECADCKRTRAAA